MPPRTAGGSLTAAGFVRPLFFAHRARLMQLDLSNGGGGTQSSPEGLGMNVQALMNPDVKYAGTDASVADVIAVMKKNDCGVVPIVNAQNKVVGMITDRDICLALGRRPLPAAAIPVTEVMSRRVYACGPLEEIPAALRTMKNKKVRRLPVIDNGRLVGILSLDDIVRHAETRKAETDATESELDYWQTVDTLKAIYERPDARMELKRLAARAAALQPTHSL